MSSNGITYYSGKNESVGRSLLTLFLTLVMAFVMFFFDGWILSTIWGYWITPVFGITLTIFTAGGISLVFNYFIGRISIGSYKNDNTEDISLFMKYFWRIVGGLISLFLNWLIYIFVFPCM